MGHESSLPPWKRHRKGYPLWAEGAGAFVCADLLIRGPLLDFVSAAWTPTVFFFFLDCLGQFRTPAPLAYLSARYLFLIHELGYIRRGKGKFVCVSSLFAGV